ncbi:hypothetical protein Q8A67_003542 [Cirrhinus molitorella]|uniref:Uncharacterized protein n=1 Tax=Cirrhinus molitorella TaxID=172907 RepID=A0AA88Q878_9TELE|nr:hypothetical protein Q8A67_003542 [Cirrhinus molitorella]
MPSALSWCDDPLAPPQNPCLHLDPLTNQLHLDLLCPWRMVLVPASVLVRSSLALRTSSVTLALHLLCFTLFFTSHGSTSVSWVSGSILVPSLVGSAMGPLPGCSPAGSMQPSVFPACRASDGAVQFYIKRWWAERGLPCSGSLRQTGAGHTQPSLDHRETDRERQTG